MIKVTTLKIPELKVIEPEIFMDERGYFFESFNQKDFKKTLGLDINFVQDNQSRSSLGVIRGLHFQIDPFGQGKLVRVLSGEVFDVAVDLRRNSKTFANWVGLFLSDENKKQLWIPPGFGHGFLTLSEEAEVQYKTTNYWNKDYEISLNFSDKELNITLPTEDINPEKIQQSFKDINSKNLEELLKNDKLFI